MNLPIKSINAALIFLVTTSFLPGRSRSIATATASDYGVGDDFHNSDQQKQCSTPGSCGVQTDEEEDVTADLSSRSWSWGKILESRKQIVANGNVWPPTADESSLDCLVLVTRNQIMWHCPSGDDNSYERTIFHRKNPEHPGKYRGVFMGLGSEDGNGAGRRMWLLYSPRGENDRLLELDTVKGVILQNLVIENCIDGHDSVRVGNSVFIVDTRHGDVVEVAVPVSAYPYSESSIRAGAQECDKEGYVNIRKRHKGFTRADHLNNVAIHPDLLISNLHGKGGTKPGIQNGAGTSPTRLSALGRSIPDYEGRELTAEKDGFKPVENVGTWCHGIAFWEDTESSQIKLISLDSKSGTAVSVVLAGPNQGSREVLWTPDLNHPVLVPPEDVARTYKDGAKVFSKGLAVQGGVAHFGVSYARAPKLRATVPETLLVAVDLSTKKEIWVRRIKSNGLINQIMTRSNLGDIQLPAEMSSVELTHHGADRKIMKMISGDVVNATVTFVQNHQCLDGNGVSKRIPLEMKSESNALMLSDIGRDLNYLVKHICNVNVKPIQKLVSELGDEGFTHSAQLEKNNAVITGRKAVLDKFKPGVKSAMLIFSTKNVAEIYHFPWLKEWLPLIEEHILLPLGIRVNQIVRMHFSNMEKGSEIKFHKDKNRWVQIAHRVHVPIITHPEVYFLTRTVRGGPASAILRIKSNAGEVYEFNNAKGHAVRNDGASRVHLIIDWADEAMYGEEGSGPAKLVTLRPKDLCSTPQGSQLLRCDKDAS